MKIEAGTASFGIEIPFARFAPLAIAHFARVKNTAEIEMRGQLLIQRKFPGSEVRDFISRVCAWGGYSGISGRVLKCNGLVEIRRCLSEAVDCLTEPTPDIADALHTLRQLKGLGLSFASKHLRFLCPELCPVFDSILLSALPYSFDGVGYAKFASDCRRLAAELTQLDVPNPWPERDGRWFAADVEASIYEYVRNGIAE